MIINSDNDKSKMREKVSGVKCHVQSGYHRSVCGGLDCCIRSKVITIIITLAWMVVCLLFPGQE